MPSTETLLLALGIVALFAALYFTLRNEVIRRRVMCPRKHVEAEVEVVQRYEGRQKPVRIRSCSLMDDPRHVTCEQDCLTEV